MERKEPINATCPECRGPLTAQEHNGIVEFHCLVGHAYSPRALLQAHSETQERTLWSAVVVLEEASNLVAAVSAQVSPQELTRLSEQAEVKKLQAGQIRRLLKDLEPFQTD
jgi:two-component system chemotaxis response regulator CheB